MNMHRGSRRALIAAAAFTTLMLSACQREPTDRTSVEAKQSMLFSLATRFRVDPATIEPESFMQVIWNDDCYGIAQDRACNPGTFFGYRIEAAIGGELYAYHALVDDPFRVMLADGPDPGIGLPALAWLWMGDDIGCQSLAIAPDGLAAIGLCGGPHAAHALLDETGRPEEWQHFYGRFAPFELTTSDQALSFYGPGTTAASPAWQRALASWAALQWEEIQRGGSGAAYGRGLAATRPVTDAPGQCHFLEVTEYGRAAVTRAPCDGRAGAETARYGWLDDDLWGQISSWYITWSSIYDTQLGIEFYTEGSNPVSEADKGQLVRVVDQVVERLAGQAPAAP
jgi:hypothetical protein